MANGYSVESQVRALIEDRSEAIARKWLDELSKQLPVEPQRIFPQRTLLNHVPMLLRRVAEAATGAQILEQPCVREEVRALARLRRSQGYAGTELAHEFDLLGAIVMDELQAACSLHARDWPLPEAVVVIRRLQRALVGLAKSTMDAFEVEESSDHYERAQLLDTFGRAVTHELRNRLNAVSLALALHTARLEQEAHVTPAVHDTLDGLARRLENVESVVEDVFIVAIAHGRADPGERSFRPLSEVVAHIVTDAQAHARTRDVELRVGELPIFAVDGTRVGLILVNLVSNSIKYSNGDSKARWVEISARRANDTRWQVRVADNGIGIPADQQAKVFERFNRGDAPDEVDGEGIGLYLAQRAAAQLGSELRLHSEPGHGTVFEFDVQEPNENLPR